MTKFYLAPMEGVTTYTYRNIFDEFYGGIDKYYTPFISSVGLKGKVLREISKETNNVSNLVPQILTNNPETFLIIADKLKNMGYKEVNLNIGCPSKTVTSKGRGAAMLRDLDALSDFLKEITENSSMDISVKTRLGIESISEWPKILDILNKFNIKELTIHARLLNEMYKGNAHMDVFAESMHHTDIPLCYNGDITDMDSYQRLMELCDGSFAVMIGRGLIADPALALKLANAYDDVTDNKIDKRFINFHKKLFAVYTERFSGDKQMLYKIKELWTFWNTYLNIDPKIYKKIIKSKSIAEYKGLVAMLGL